MADERHIAIVFLSIYRHNIGRLMQNLERRWRITCRYRSRDQNGNFFQIQDRGRHIENHFSYLGAILADVCESRIADITCKQRSRDQKRNFRQFNMNCYVESSYSAFKHNPDSCNELKLYDVFQ